MAKAVTAQNIGRITQIIGPVMDVTFPPGNMPNIYNALIVEEQTKPDRN